MHLYRSIIHLVSLVFGTAPISIDHLPTSLCLIRVGIAPISIGHSSCHSSSCHFKFLRPHLYWSVIVISVKFEFLGSYLYRSVIFLSVCVQFEFSGPHLYRSIDHSYCQFNFRDCTYINRSSSYQFVFNLSWDRTYIDQSSSYQFKFGFSRLHLYQSVIFLPVCVQFELGPHLYRLIIILSVWVWVLGSAPISISHLPIILC